MNTQTTHDNDERLALHHALFSFLVLFLLFLLAGLLQYLESVTL